jgi:hypothetical protein
MDMAHDIPLDVLNPEFRVDEIEINDRGFYRSSVDGAVNYLSISNFYWGEKSFGARIMNWNWREYCDGVGGGCNPYGFILGGVSALGTEIGVMGYIVNSSGLSWKEVLLSNIGFKSGLRFVDWMHVRTKDLLREEREKNGKDDREVVVDHT